MTTNFAYVAGLIDGEGCIHLEHSRTTYRARLSVGMTEPALPLLQSLQAEWGGTLYQQRQATERWAAAWTWHATGPNAKRVIETIEPFLRLKQEQARIALEVEAIRDALERRANGDARWTPEAQARCAVLKERMHDLNRKGPRVPASNAGAA